MAGNEQCEELTIGQIFNGLSLDAYIFRDGNLHYVPSEDGSHWCGGLIDATHSFVQRVINSEAPGFELLPKTKQGYRKFKPTELSQQFLLIHHFAQAYPIHFDVSEYVRLFQGLVAQTMFKAVPLKAAAEPVNQSGKVAADLYNELIDRIRQASRERAFKQRCHIRALAAENNFKSGKTYVEHLFNQYPQLLLIRLECFVSQNNLEEAGESIAHACLKKLWNNRRTNKLFANMVGYIWKLDYHDHQGHYIHFMLFFSDVAGLDAEKLTEQIGNYWVSRITKNKGHYRSCVKLPNEYRSSCIGVIDGRDQAIRTRLLRAICYLTKKEQYLRYRFADNDDRSFGRGKMLFAEIE